MRILISAIYQILNLTTNKCYIGSAVNLNLRFKNHRHELRYNKHPNKYLQRSWNKYGESAFEFILVELAEPSKLLEREQYWIDNLDCINPKGYNSNPTAGSRLGTNHSEETKLKMSTRIRTKQELTRLKNLNLGRKASEETKAKLSKIRKGNMSESHKQKLIASNKTPEARENKRLAKIGKPSNQKKSSRWKHVGGHWRCKCDLCKAQINEYKMLKLREYRADV